MVAGEIGQDGRSAVRNVWQTTWASNLEQESAIVRNQIMEDYNVPGPLPGPQNA